MTRSKRIRAATKPDCAFEREAWAEGLRVAGVDEVGRGALAGPVVAAAVIFEPGRVPDGLDDSKKLTAARREELDERIRADALCWSVARVEHDVIDRINILRASFEAMRDALVALAPSADHLLVDGHLPIPDWAGSQRSIVGGDARSASIAAASILAKVARDRIMRDYDATHPGYDFGAHAGYGTAAHRSAIARLGPSPIHRRSFRGVVQLDLLP
jgi:ribonuclease HII